MTSDFSDGFQMMPLSGGKYLSSGYRLINPLFGAFERLKFRVADIRGPEFVKRLDGTVLEAWRDVAVERRYADRSLAETWDLAALRATFREFQELDEDWVLFPEIPGKRYVFRGDSAIILESFGALLKEDNYPAAGRVVDVGREIEWPALLSTTYGDPMKHNFINQKKVIWQFSLPSDGNHPGRRIGTENPSEEEMTFPLGTRVRVDKLVFRAEGTRTDRQDAVDGIVRPVGPVAHTVVLATVLGASLAPPLKLDRTEPVRIETSSVAGAGHAVGTVLLKKSPGGQLAQYEVQEAGDIAKSGKTGPGYKVRKVNAKVTDSLFHDTPDWTVRPGGLGEADALEVWPLAQRSPWYWQMVSEVRAALRTRTFATPVAAVEAAHAALASALAEHHAVSLPEVRGDWLVAVSREDLVRVAALDALGRWDGDLALLRDPSFLRGLSTEGGGASRAKLTRLYGAADYKEFTLAEVRGRFPEPAVNVGAVVLVDDQLTQERRASEICPCADDQPAAYRHLLLHAFVRAQSGGGRGLCDVQDRWGSGADLGITEILARVATDALCAAEHDADPATEAGRLVVVACARYAYHDADEPRIPRSRGELRHRGPVFWALAKLSGEDLDGALREYFTAFRADAADAGAGPQSGAVLIPGTLQVQIHH
ncbi:hypothetical protein [Streptomyces noursei]|uniref:hypothetical protein n=1 Tax=Streptomyces noursei TaxID=1971 RepID=UPI00167AE422|nr:hypothetical protein [Streptomyces noursei]MCZ1021260.1 hypothetical protein [Streptomyces noursei]GGX54804.1 hypothetical protein GCM10010341_89780 [Streptomyces noursei]